MTQMPGSLRCEDRKYVRKEKGKFYAKVSFLNHAKQLSLVKILSTNNLIKRINWSVGHINGPQRIVIDKFKNSNLYIVSGRFP